MQALFRLLTTPLASSCEYTVARSAPSGTAAVLACPDARRLPLVTRRSANGVLIFSLTFIGVVVLMHVLGKFSK